MKDMLGASPFSRVFRGFFSFISIFLVAEHKSGCTDVKLPYLVYELGFVTMKLFL